MKIIFECTKNIRIKPKTIEVLAKSILKILENYTFLIIFNLGDSLLSYFERKGLIKYRCRI